MKLKEVYTEISKILHIKDQYLIDLVLAICVSRIQRHTKLWLFVIGNSSSGKSELLELIDDKGKTTKEIKDFSRNTLVSGFQKRGGERVDLALKLKDKVALIKEGAVILNLHQQERSAVFSQLRDLYDGKAGANKGNGTDVHYNNLNVSMIMCSTNIIDDHLLIHNALGTREYLYRIEDEENQEKKSEEVDLILNKIKEKASLDTDKLREEIRKKVREFIDNTSYKDIEVKPEIDEKIRRMIKIITKLRVVPQCDFSNCEVNDLVYPEEPARIYFQMLVTYKALKSLDEDYSDEKALKILQKIMLSSSKPIRVEVIKYIMQNYLIGGKNKINSRDIANYYKLNPKTIKVQLNTLSNEKIGILKREERLLCVSPERWDYDYTLEVKNPLVQELAEALGFDLKDETENIGVFKV